MNSYASKHRSPPLEKRELWILSLLSLCLLWTTWTVGGVKLWAQCGTNVLALAAFCAAVWPSGKGGYSNLRTLLRFVPFWLGLFVAAYIATQALNASWLLETGADGRTHALRLDYVKWLPTGVTTARHAMNPWLMLLIFVPGWLVTCTIWCGCKRPKSMRSLMWLLAVNGAVFAIIGVIQAMTDAQKVLWLFDRPVAGKGFWGMLANQNHAAAFMNLSLAAALALFIYYTGRHARDFAKGGVYLMLIPLSVLIVVGVLQAMSRAGIVVAAIIVLVFIGVLSKRLVKVLRQDGNKTLVIASASIMALIIATVAIATRNAVNMDKLNHEVRSMFAVADDPEHDARFFINKASIALFEKHPAYGWGAGCYRYFISSEQKAFPQLMLHKNRPMRLVFAHNEYLNSLCDLGIVGSIPLFAGIVFLPAYVFIYKRKGIDGAIWVGLAGIGAAMLHMSLEFFMQHPLVALQFAILLATVTRMACLSHSRILVREEKRIKAGGGSKSLA
jgi:hypothetical protein